MANEPKQIDFWLAVNEDGGWSISSDESEALSDLAENEGGYLARVVKFTVHIDLPVCSTVDVVVPPDAGQGVTIEATD